MLSASFDSNRGRFFGLFPFSEQTCFLARRQVAGGMTPWVTLSAGISALLSLGGAVRRDERCHNPRHGQGMEIDRLASKIILVTAQRDARWPLVRDTDKPGVEN
jgi:hypothetical protein